MSVLPRIFLLLVIFLLNSCFLSESSTKFRSELANQGPITLSENNPYIAGNLLLSKEMETSPILKGFVERKGTPDAIEIRKIYFTADQLTFYYLNDHEYYSLDQSSNNWLIKGPYKITSDMLGSLKNLPTLNSPAPLINLNMGENSAAEVSSLPAANELPEITFVKPEVTNSRSNPNRASLKKDYKIEKSSKKNSGSVKEDNEISPAEVSIAGDIIHKVTSDDEDLKTIVKWYTGNAGNSGRIARINGLDDQNKLNLNQTIRIPRYLVKNSNPLPHKKK